VTRPNADPAEVSYLVVRCRLMLDAVEAAEPEFSGIAQLRAIVEATAASNDVRGLRTIRRDLLEMSRGLPTGARDALQAQLDAQAADDPFGRAAS